MGTRRSTVQWQLRSLAMASRHIECWSAFWILPIKCLLNYGQTVWMEYELHSELSQIIVHIHTRSSYLSQSIHFFFLLIHQLLSYLKFCFLALPGDREFAVLLQTSALSVLSHRIGVIVSYHLCHQVMGGSQCFTKDGHLDSWASSPVGSWWYT